MTSTSMAYRAGQDAEPVWRTAGALKPGWFVRMEGVWREVRMVMEFDSGPGRRAGRGVQIVTADGFTASAGAGAEVATLTVREAKRAGVAGPGHGQ